MEQVDYLNSLNPQQRKAVAAPEGQILVLAGPGSGKTRVLTHRIAYVIDSLGVRPDQILAVTFTNKAAREMGERADKLLGRPNGVWLGTFHGICARILRREVSYLPLAPNFVIFDADDQVALVRRAVRDLNLDEKMYRPASVHGVISNAKNNLMTPEQLPVKNYREEVIQRVYARYQQLLLENNAVDFDDLLMLAVQLFWENPSVRERYAQRFHHVLVDEFQDTNGTQYELVKAFSSYHHNLFVVGDEDQSIYRWRGADYHNVMRFESDYPAHQKILLEQNYRSTQMVLDAATAVIRRNLHRTHKELFTSRGPGDKIVLYEASDDHAEAAYVVDSIRQWLDNRKSGAKGGDFAVMYRTNAQSRLLEEAFLRAGIPYRLVGAQRFYGRREVKDVLAFLRLVHNPSDEVSLNRVINVPARGIGDKTIVALQLAARKARTTPGKLLLDLGRNGNASAHWAEFNGRSGILLSDFGAMVAGWIQAKEDMPLPQLLDKILEDTDYQNYIDDNTDEGHDRWDNVKELKRLSYEWAERGLAEFLETVALVSDADTVPEHADAPTLLTLHAAKGLEFPQVFIVGLDEGILPHSRSKDDPEEMAEERRLFYVGITRAKDRLYLVRADSRSSYGSYEMQDPSQFLQDLPDELVKRDGARRSGYGSSYRDYRKATTWDDSESGITRTKFPEPEPRKVIRPARSLERKYQPAMRVRHPSWGEGMVIESRVDSEGEETVDIMFESVGFKRVIASLANLEIIRK
jgi:DNA helicase-2/ATP-dependent DNA helicase PcrA